MKRKYRETQQRVDESLLAAINNGITDAAELKQVLVDGWQGYNVGELVDCFARTELSAAKQRLRNAGHIEITKGNVPKPVDDLESDDVDFIVSRRLSDWAGRTREIESFCRQHNREEVADQVKKQLDLFTKDIEQEQPDPFDPASYEHTVR